MICTNCGCEVILPETIAHNKIIDTVLEFYHTSLDHLKKRNRRRERVFARQVIYYLLKKHTRLKLKTIGEVFLQDHTTVIHAIQTIEDLMFSDSTVKSDIEHLELQLIQNKNKV